MTTDIAVKEQPMSERFMLKVTALFNTNVGDLALTNFQKRLAQNYFIVADSVLKKAEEKRLKKSEDYRDPLSYTWANVNMEELAESVVAAARVGWDPTQDNHVSLIPFKQNGINKYGLTFMPGYRGRQLRAVKYGLDVPDDVIVELVYSTDKFKSHKKDHKNTIEHYEFDIMNDFDRGEIVGGFYYHIFFDHPEKNKLVVFSKKHIEKRRPEKASAEFWGGEKTVYEDVLKDGKVQWKDGKKVQKKVQVQSEGWYEKMCYKTVFIAAYKDITIDSQKIDDDYLRLNQLENDFKEVEVEREIAENANGNVVDIQGEDVPEVEGITDAEIVEMDKKAEEKAAKGPGF